MSSILIKHHLPLVHNLSKTTIISKYVYIFMLHGRHISLTHLLINHAD